MNERVRDAVVVGAGFSGMGAVLALRRQGLPDVVVLERHDDLGGTWHANTYPGLAVDVPAHTYSFSFAPNPDWSRMYVPGAELKGYAQHIAERYDLRRDMVFGQTVTGTRWDALEQCWVVEVRGHAPVRGRLLVLATGFLSQVKRPAFAGLDDFEGEVVHTAEWDHSLDLRGKRVALVGTGATAVQLLPEIAKVAGHTTVYQRTPIHVLPKVDPEMPAAVRRLYRRVPLAQRAVREAGGALYEGVLLAALYHRKAPWVAKSLGALCEANLRLQVRDETLRARLRPDYTFGCKRPTFSNDYFDTFERPDVKLVTSGIGHLEQQAIVDEEGQRHPTDVLVLATGFHVQDEGNYPPFPVTGKQDLELGHHWRRTRYSSYEGITAAGFPNLLNLVSPYAYSGLSYFQTIEVQMAHMDRLLGEMQQQGAAAFEVTAEAQERFMAEMDRREVDSLWAAGNCASANSYYRNSQGHSALTRLTPTALVKRRARSFPLDDYTFTLPLEVELPAARRDRVATAL